MSNFKCQNKPFRDKDAASGKIRVRSEMVDFGFPIQRIGIFDRQGLNVFATGGVAFLR
jgi:hypothetical protein